MKLTTKIAASLLGLAALAGCGGGGSDDGDGKLYISMSWSGEGYLMQDSLVRVAISGLEGHDPHCFLKSGSLPPGMAITSNCNILGKPRAMGTYYFVADFSVEDGSNHLAFGGAVTVFGPSTIYSIPSQLKLGQALDVSPLNTFWKPQAGNTVTYQVLDGSLPPGLTLTPATGRISGAMTTMGSYSARIGATVTADVGTAQVAQDVPLMFAVGGLGLSYPTVQGTVGVPLNAAVPIGKQPGTTYTFAWDAGFTPPAGLLLDPATGTISGKPAAATSSASLRVAATAGGATQVLQTGYSAAVPYGIGYSCSSGRVGQPFSCMPTVTSTSQAINAGVIPSSATYSYVLSSGAIPPGLALDVSTGRISGTPTASSSQLNGYTVTVTLNGVTFDLTASGLLAVNN